MRKVLVFWGILASGCGGEVLLMGLGPDEQEIEAFVNSHQYGEELAKIIGATSESTLPVLEQDEALRGPRWKLRTVAVGLGFEMEFGLGERATVGATPQIRLGFTHGPNGPMP